MEMTFEGVCLRSVEWHFDKKTCTTVNVPRTSIVAVYNESMGIVDLTDTLMALYRIQLRSKKR